MLRKPSKRLQRLLPLLLQPHHHALEHVSYSFKEFQNLCFKVLENPDNCYYQHLLLHSLFAPYV